MGFKRDRPLSMENGHESKIMVNMEGPVASPSCVEKESLLNHVPCKLQSTLTAYFETNNHKGLREQTTTKFLHNKANSSLTAKTSAWRVLRKKAPSSVATASGRSVRNAAALVLFAKRHFALRAPVLITSPAKSLPLVCLACKAKHSSEHSK
ncbi:uncharacterized protein LOC135120603 isoform X1 [Zophobas morio]|uniref:uncharacterized protein LOC135120603 isoform X1 n=1 Tax=Zophobas morio TaxID=2755281 RepID=UPI003082DBD2